VLDLDLDSCSPEIYAKHSGPLANVSRADGELLIQTVISQSIAFPKISTVGPNIRCEERKFRLRGHCLLQVQC